ncbi:Retrovirus-related Pol polyprotein from transposon RE1 [Euphorbia peplus]|nr:Retrovirus-related Pol polyprotein from transposon RE1 [Euphorbia peplus]
MPQKFWGEAVLQAAALINILPSRILNWHSPFEIFHSTTPNYSDQHVFGTLVSYKTLPVSDKFSPRAHNGVFLSNALYQKGYKLYDLTTHKIVVSRDVIFHEDIFPFTPTSDSTSTNPHILPNLTSQKLNLLPTISAPTSSTHTSSIPLPQTSQPLRKSSRITQHPSWMNDFVMTAHTYQTNPHHTSFLSAIQQHKEPKNYTEASKIPVWVDAMNTEFKALEDNNTWEIVDLPPGAHSLASLWVFKTKFLPNGDVERCKARLVAKGYKQTQGVNFHESFSPVAKVVTVRLLLAIGAAKNWAIHQIDVNNAYLHGTIEEDIYLTPPPGYTKAKPGQVCKLIKSLYGLKQAGRQWHHELSTKLQSFGFCRSRNDHCLFTKSSPQGFLALIIYVDDILITGSHEEEIVAVKQYLHSLFTIKDLGNVKYFLGIEIARSPAGIILSQTKYITDIIKDAGLTNATPVSSPFLSGMDLTKPGEPLTNPDVYRRLVGRLLYLNFTRADITYATQQLSQYMQNPCKHHLDAAMEVLKYLKGSASNGLFYPAQSNSEVQGYCDSDWGGCRTSRRSLSGFCIFFGDCLISWKSKKQGVVSKSSAEAEYRCMSTTCSELKWISYLLKDFEINLTLPITLHCDSQSAIEIAKNPVFHEKMKHVEIDCHYVRDCVEEGFVKTPYVQSKFQLADVFTKILSSAQMQPSLAKMGFLSSATIPA